MHEFMLTSVSAKQLQETPQENMIHTFDKVWSKGVLEVAKSSVRISEQGVVKHGFVKGGSSY